MKTVTYDPAVYKLVPVAETPEWRANLTEIGYSHKTLFKDILQSVPDQLPGVVVHSGDAYGAMYQNDETGNMVCVDAWQIANGFEDNNKRLRKVCDIYTHPAPSQPSAEALVAAALEAAAKYHDDLRDDFINEHGSIDPETGTLEFGTGIHAELREEYVADLAEHADAIRALDKQKIIDGAGK